MVPNVISSTALADLQSEFFKKSHQLVFSQLALSPVEHDIMALFLTKLHKEHWDDYIYERKIEQVPRYEFSSSLLSEWFGVEKKYLYSTLEKPAERLSGKSIGVRKEGQKMFDFIPLFKRIRYEDGVLTVVPNDELMGEYLCLSQGHSQIPHKQFRAIDLEHAKRLFTMLCRFKTGGTLHAQSIEDLHAFFGLNDKSGNLLKKTYGNTSVFIRRIIKPAIESIDKEVPEIKFDVDSKTGNYGFGYVKEGRTIVGIKFLFSWDFPVEQPCNMQKGEELDQVSLTYDLVVGFEPGVPGNPTVEELSDLMASMPKMLELGRDFGVEFMEKYSMAMVEAQRRGLG